MQRYRVNQNNQLIVNNKVLNGDFYVDEDNTLIYSLESADKIKFKGNWKIGPNHNLILSLIEGDELKLNGRIIAAEKEQFVFSIVSENAKQQGKISLIKLKGFWQADAYNRLAFLVEKESNDADVLTLELSWQINDNQQIIYRYQHTDLIRKTKSDELIIFQGYWLINQRNRLRYVLEKGVSEFDFRVQIESPKFFGKKGELRYRLGIGVKGEDNFKQPIISVFGAWKFGKRGEVLFAIDYQDGKLRLMRFGASVYIDKKDEVTFELSTAFGEDLGISLTLKRKVLKGEAYLRLKKLEEEGRIEAGVKIPW